MTDYEIREANRYYWIVKGTLIPESWGEEEVERIHRSYFKRIWGNHENVVHQEGFEEAWKARVSTSVKQTERLELVKVVIEQQMR